MIDGLSITAGSGRVTVSGRAGQALDLKVAIRALPLSLARIAARGEEAIRESKRRWLAERAKARAATAGFGGR